MKQISNWVFGSFFRTIGRLLVFILLGVIIANFIDFGSIKDNFSITNLFLDKVKADTIIQDRYTPYYTDSSRNTLLSSNQGFYYNTYTTSTSTSLDFTIKTYFTDVFNIASAKGSYIEIPFYINVPIVRNGIQYSNDIDMPYCKRYDCSIYDANGECDRWTCTEYVETSTFTFNDSEYLNPKIKLQATLNMVSGRTYTCIADMNAQTFKCPIDNTSNFDVASVSVKSYVYYSTSNTYNYQIGLYQHIHIYKNELSSIDSSINNQSQQQHSDHQETQSYLEDSNTTQAENSASSFFSSFSVNLGGLTGIITAPLNTIQSLLNSTCTNLVLPLPFVNKNLTLPCMNDIYTQHFGVFFTLYQTIILGIIAYRCIMSIFFDIKGFTNPDDDRIEVMDL